MLCHITKIFKLRVNQCISFRLIPLKKQTFGRLMEKTLCTAGVLISHYFKKKYLPLIENVNYGPETFTVLTRLYTFEKIHLKEISVKKLI